MGQAAEKRDRQDRHSSRGRDNRSQPSTEGNRLQPRGGDTYAPNQDRIRELLQNAANNPPPGSDLSQNRRPVTSGPYDFVDVEYFLPGQKKPRIVRQAIENGKLLDE